jgi:predicted neuraminidase
MISSCARKGLICHAVWILAVSMACAVETPQEDLFLKPLVVKEADKMGPYLNPTRKWQGIPGLERTASGRLWATWYTGGSGEGRDNYIVLVTSTDDGKTWSQPKVIIDPLGLPRAFDPCVWIDPRGRLWLFWAQGYHGSDVTYHKFENYQQRAGVWAMVTDNPDDADPIWTEPRRLCDGVVMNKPLVRANGEWLLPASVWDSKKGIPSPPNTGANVMVSKDEGQTWTFRGRVIPPSRTFDEHNLDEDKAGVIRMWTRTHMGAAESLSKDGGVTWSEPVFRKDMSPSASKIFVRRLKSGRLLLVSNYPPEGRKRTHLTARLSDDNGVTWNEGLLLDEREEGTGVSYPDGIEGSDGVIRVIYDLDRDRTGQILMATFTEDDVLKGRWLSPSARSKELIERLMVAEGTPNLN